MTDEERRVFRHLIARFWWIESAVKTILLANPQVARDFLKIMEETSPGMNPQFETVAEDLRRLLADRLPPEKPN